MLECAFEDIGDDLHVAVRMRRESPARRHAVVIDDAQRAESHVLWVVVVPEGKTVLAIEPTKVRPAALLCFPYRECHFSSPCGG